MDIQPLSNPPTAAPTSRKSAAISSDFETFLKMLTVQMQNQDPLNPIDSTDYAVQLATFSGVEQQVRTNQILSELSELLGGSGLGQAAQWIGKDVLAVAPASFAGDPLTIDIPAAVYARVSEVRASDEGLVFTLPGGIEVAFSEVTGVRAGA
jgi:flagellar hook assembly protein FlgD